LAERTLPQPRSAAEEARALRPRAFALELTKGCNLRCSYCYYAEREAAYDPRTRMSREVAERSVELLLAQGPPDQPAHVHFFGGEPLLDFPLLSATTLFGERRARELGRSITWEVTTNGTRLEPEVIAFLNEHAIAVGISFDGPPEVQDAARPLKGGSSYDLAAPRIRALLASRAGTPLEAKTHCSVVLTRRDLDLVAIVRHLEGLGFRRILLTPATDPAGKSQGFREQDLERLQRSFEELADEYERRVLAGEPVAETWFPRLVGRILSGEKRTQFCSGGRDYLGVAADGSLALCYRFFEDPAHAMGSVQTGIERGVSERILAHPLDERTTCSSCWARYFCGGGCHHDNLVTTGALEEPNPVACELFRHSMSRALASWARLTRAGKLPGRKDSGARANGMDRGEIADEARPRSTSGLHVRALDDERVVYDPATHEVVVLNESAGFVFGLCDGQHSVAEILAAMRRRYGAPEERLRADLARVLAELRERRLVAP
jgi:uncharacterized protein